MLSGAEAQSFVGRIGYVVAAGDIHAYEIHGVKKLGLWRWSGWGVLVRHEDKIVCDDDPIWPNPAEQLIYDFEEAKRVARTHVEPMLEYYGRRQASIAERGAGLGQYNRAARAMRSPFATTA